MRGGGAGPAGGGDGGGRGRRAVAEEPPPELALVFRHLRDALLGPLDREPLAQGLALNEQRRGGRARPHLRVGEQESREGREEVEGLLDLFAARRVAGLFRARLVAVTVAAFACATAACATATAACAPAVGGGRRGTPGASAATATSFAVIAIVLASSPAEEAIVTVLGRLGRDDDARGGGNKTVCFFCVFCGVGGRATQTNKPT